LGLLLIISLITEHQPKSVDIAQDIERRRDDSQQPSPRFDLSIRTGALDLPKDDPASAIEALIRTNDWGKELLKRLREKNRIASLLPFFSPRHKQVN
jgi:hypothetical protein